MLAPPQPNDISRPPSPPSHHPTNAYTTGLPAPPRILIPPPSLNPSDSNGLPEWQQPTLQSMILQCDPILQGPAQDWRYEFRREAQQLLPHLFLGPLSATKNQDFLRSKNITLLLAVRSNMTARARLLSSQLAGVRYESIDVGSNQELISQFQRAGHIIDEHYISALPAGEAFMAANHTQQPPGGRTLLFCESGNERSAIVAAAYVMQHLRGSTIQAIQLVQAKRFCVCFDDSMKWMLSNYEPILIARRMQQGAVQQQNDGGGGSGGGGGGGAAVVVGGSGKGKRRFDEDDGDEEWNGGGRAPFLDQYESEDLDMS
ncbi:protein-tyrosine phosphatase-like protein [Tricharina praecox]|uniref:protein-tyrosine phosphatase-like protein n=1 Tax=Tricharina praecox TaxID=43433 RepID=UPI002220DA8C|nr:protein-tyrosine phosphatase-like protein [Tricharina praecox]KAI5851034.1 protein-tyrosine phosphatase-like protein [Tricharina praecox]